jgi:hypothetical protein
MVACNQVPEIRDKQRAFREEAGNGQGGDRLSHPLPQNVKCQTSISMFFDFLDMEIPLIN